MFSQYDDRIVNYCNLLGIPQLIPDVSCLCGPKPILEQIAACIYVAAKDHSLPLHLKVIVDATKAKRLALIRKYVFLYMRVHSPEVQHHHLCELIQNYNFLISYLLGNSQLCVKPSPKQSSDSLITVATKIITDYRKSMNTNINMNHIVLATLFLMKLSFSSIPPSIKVINHMASGLKISSSSFYTKVTIVRDYLISRYLPDLKISTLNKNVKYQKAYEVINSFYSILV